jgi:hypothetical protein
MELGSKIGTPPSPLSGFFITGLVQNEELELWQSVHPPAPKAELAEEIPWLSLNVEA